MKIILTGSTGFAGTEILNQCIAHNYIEHVYVLTRRPLDAKYSHKKVTQILHEDFETYPDDLLNRLRDEGVEACIWALGGKTKDLKSLDNSRKVNVNFVAAAAEAFAKHLAPGLKPYPGYPGTEPKPGVGRFPFRFIYVSAWGAEHNQFRKLWIGDDDRKLKGAAERAIFSAADDSEEKDGHKCFEAIALRPRGILAGSSEAIGTIVMQAIIPSVTSGQLARTAIRTAFDRAKDRKRILENRDLLGEDWAMVNSLN
ncbi:hypothetical protein PRZ48_007513 [Zasmidium cellare]|uniref:NAD(P)-binding domain-containing protein n=1 Tax=Zasmidium cellare TaxID=395010 RepID=A0ABR0EJY5_ZASCE|nr:hypothetical protein PRZ48_007513 [Zasmidium cellare]